MERKREYLRRWRERTGQNQKQRERYANDPEYRAARKAQQRERAQRDPRVRLVIEAKAVPCVDCGRTYLPGAMDLDHREPAFKLFDVNQSRAMAWPELFVRAEIAKCDVRCKICHVRRHDDPTWPARAQLHRTFGASAAIIGLDLGDRP